MEPTPPQALSGTFSVSGILSRTASTLMQNPVVFIGVVAAASLLPTLGNILMPGNLVMYCVMLLLSLLLGLIAQGAIAYAVYQTLRGDNAGIGDALTRGLGRLGPLLMVVLMMILVVLGLALVGGILAMITRWLAILVIIPMIIFYCMWFVTVPICVVEKLGPWESLKRSMALTQGNRPAIFALLVIAGVASLVIVFIASAVFGALTMNPIVVGVVAYLAALVPQAFTQVMTTVVYDALRSSKEGVSLGSLTNVFD